jgi:hypothetical protein
LSIASCTVRGERLKVSIMAYSALLAVHALER